MAAASPEYQLPAQELNAPMHDAYRQLLETILDALNNGNDQHLNIDDQPTIYNQMVVVLAYLTRLGYFNQEMVNHPLFDIDVTQYEAEAEADKIQALDNATEDVYAKDSDDEQTLNDKLRRGLELAHCFLQCAIRLNVDGGGYNDYKNHNDWAYTITYAIESVANPHANMHI